MGRRVHQQVLPVAREHDVVLGLENHYKDGFWKYPEFAQKKDVFLELLAAIPDRDHFGVQYDPSNAIVAGDDPIELLAAVADRVVSMHASDRYLAEGATLDDLRQTDGTLGYSPNLRHGVTGKGLNDYDAIFRILAEHGYRGWVSIEDGMNGMDEMAESLAFLRRMSAKYFPDRGAEASMDRVRTALVGCGKVGQIHAAGAGGAARVGVRRASATSTLERARAFAARYGVRPFTDVAAMLARLGAAGRRDRHAAPAARRAGDPGGRRPACTCWSRSRWPRAWPTATPCSPRRGGTGSSWASSASGGGTSRCGG